MSTTHGHIIPKSTASSRVTFAAAGAVSMILLLSSCADGDSGDPMDGGGAHSTMGHEMDGGPAPDGIAAAPDPEYPVGSEVTLAASHMGGMDGASATVVGAYQTYTYAVDFTPTTGGDPLADHRWVVQEEIVDAGAARLPDGSEVTLNAEHMTGMDGAPATIANSTEETVYMVDYEVDGMTMKNHKWVTESELRPAG